MDEDSVVWMIVAAAVILLFAVAVIKSYMKKLSQGCCGAGGDKKAAKIKVADRNRAHYPFKVILTVDGMVCSGCETRVENALNVLDGVWATADAGSGSVTVLLRAEPDEQALRRAVNSAGAYTVMKISGNVGKESE